MQNKLILLLLLVVVSGRLAAQSNTLADKKFKCTATSFTDLVSGSTVAKASVFIINAPTNTIEWQQKNGAVTNQIQITSTVDNWSNNQNTRLMLNILWNGKAGTMEVKKQNSTITLVMDVNPSGKDRLYFSFDISSLEII